MLGSGVVDGRRSVAATLVAASTTEAIVSVITSLSVFYNMKDTVL